MCTDDANPGSSGGGITLDDSNFNITFARYISSPTAMADGTTFHMGPMSRWDVSRVKKMASLFENAELRCRTVRRRRQAKAASGGTDTGMGGGNTGDGGGVRDSEGNSNGDRMGEIPTPAASSSNQGAGGAGGASSGSSAGQQGYQDGSTAGQHECACGGKAYFNAVS